MENQTKKCIKCGETKALHEFTITGKNRKSYRRSCKKCFAESQKALLATRRLNRPTKGLKICTTCGVEKEFSQFTNGHHTHGLSGSCRSCTSIKNAARKAARTPEQVSANKAYHAKRRAEKAADIAAYKRKISTGFSGVDFENAIRMQNGTCAICGIPFGGMKTVDVHADHCHTTGTPRGILCRNCNLGLGAFKDDITRLEKAIAYLKNPPMTEVLL